MSTAYPLPSRGCVENRRQLLTERVILALRFLAGRLGSMEKVARLSGSSAGKLYKAALGNGPLPAPDLVAVAYLADLLGYSGLSELFSAPHPDTRPDGSLDDERRVACEALGLASLHFERGDLLASDEAARRGIAAFENLRAEIRLARDRAPVRSPRARGRAGAFGGDGYDSPTPPAQTWPGPASGANPVS